MTKYMLVQRQLRKSENSPRERRRCPPGAVVRPLWPAKTRPIAPIVALMSPRYLGNPSRALTEGSGSCPNDTESRKDMMGMSCWKKALHSTVSNIVHVRVRAHGDHLMART